EDGRMPSVIVKESGTSQISDAGALKPIVDAVVAKHPDIVAKFKGGNLGVKGFLVGQIMKESGGRANPKLVQELIDAALAE
ncbi:Asp-tRNA(Asn)/Glu-tRNA(Gln) amidotransferase GatCAB subunit B, partial [Acinetobacter baumannii]